MDPTTYETAKKTFMSSCDMMVETLGAIQAHMAASSKSQREISIKNSALKTQLNHTEAKLKLALDELNLQREVRRDAAASAEHILELQEQVR
jgi:uncharacterized membrane protein YgdD (TMEM256/DUF423 family)